MTFLPPDGRYLLEQVIRHRDEMGHLANSTGDDLRDALRVAADEIELLRSVIRALISPIGLDHVDDDPPSLNEQAIERLRASNCVAVASGRYVDITAEQVEAIRRALGREKA